MGCRWDRESLLQHLLTVRFVRKRSLVFLGSKLENVDTFDCLTACPSTRGVANSESCCSYRSR